MAEPTPVAQYTQPHLMEPLLPQNRLDALRERTRSVIEQSYRLAGSAHPSTIAKVRELVREMNSYYSNRIEGQNTHPRQIERAQSRDGHHRERQFAGVEGFDYGTGSGKGGAGATGRRATMVSCSGLTRTVSFQPSSVGSFMVMMLSHATRLRSCTS